jgi:hypothetical protein
MDQTALLLIYIAQPDGSAYLEAERNDGSAYLEAERKSSLHLATALKALQIDRRRTSADYPFKTFVLFYEGFRSTLCQRNSRQSHWNIPRLPGL